MADGENFITSWGYGQYHIGMLIRGQTKRIERKRPLRISRGESGCNENLFVFIESEGITGVGEMAPISYLDQTAVDGLNQIESLQQDFANISPFRVRYVGDFLQEVGVPSGVRTAIDMACWDWLGKKARLPLYRLFGLDTCQTHTSLTVGISKPAEAAGLAKSLVSDMGASVLKIKLGSSDGVSADQAQYQAILDAIPNHVSLRVDANGGWDLREAIIMSNWLQERRCEYIEQPLAVGDESSLTEIKNWSSIPIFLDESVNKASDIPKIAGLCDGLNMKLMKAGGITEAFRIAHTARSHGLGLMIGCFSESSVSIAAGLSIASLFDYIDLDSHLNMNPDPATGLGFINGYVQISDCPGLGVSLR